MWHTSLRKSGLQDACAQFLRNSLNQFFFHMEKDALLATEANAVSNTGPQYSVSYTYLSSRLLVQSQPDFLGISIQ